MGRDADESEMLMRNKKSKNRELLDIRNDAPIYRKLKPVASNQKEKNC